MKVKKITSLVLSLLIMIMPIITSAADTDSVKTEPSAPKIASFDTGYTLTQEEGTLGMLSALHLISPLNWQGETLSQGDFLEAVARLKGYAGEYEAESVSNYVIPGDNVQAVINYAVSMGIISDGISFDPYKPIKWGFAVEMICDVLGYRDYADVRGGYTTLKAYRDMINGHKTADEVSGPDGCALIANAMDRNILEITGISSIGQQYSDKEMLSYESMKITHIKGLVSATGIATIGENTANDSVIINNIIYRDNLGIYQKYVGLEVDAWVDDDGNIAYMYADVDDNDIIVVDAADIGTFTQRKLTYYNDKGRSKTINYVAPIIVYNGKNLTADDYDKYESIVFSPEVGSVSVIRLNGGKCILHITSVKSMVVGSTDINSNSVYDKFINTKLLKIEPEEYYHRLVDINGNEKSFADISEDMIIDYEVSLDEGYVFAVLSEKSMRGDVSSESDDEIGVDGKTYRVLTSAIIALGEPVVGGEYTFYLNLNGDIFHYERIPETSIKAFLLAVAPPKGTFDQIVRIKVATNKNQVHNKDFPILTLAEKVRIDGNVWKDADKAYAALMTEGAFKQIPIVYTLNSEGLVKKIDTPTYNYGKEPEESLHIIADNVSHRLVNMSAHNYGYSMSDAFIGRTDAMIVTPAVDGSDNIRFDTPDISKRTMSAYSLSGANSWFADFIIYAPGTTISYNLTRDIFFVSSVMLSLDNNGDTRYKLEIVNASGSKEYLVHSDVESIAKTLDCGDAIRIHVNANQEIYKLKKLYDYDEESFAGEITFFWDDTREVREVFGTVMSKQEKAIMLNTYGVRNEIFPVQEMSLYEVSVLPSGRVAISPIRFSDIKSAENYVNYAHTLLMTTSYNKPNIMYFISD